MIVRQSTLRSAGFENWLHPTDFGWPGQPRFGVVARHVQQAETMDKTEMQGKSPNRDATTQDMAVIILLFFLYSEISHEQKTLRRGTRQDDRT